MHVYTPASEYYSAYAVAVGQLQARIQVRVNQFASRATPLLRMLIHRPASSTGVPAFKPAMQRNEPAQRVRFRIICIMEIVNMAVCGMLMEDIASMNGTSPYSLQRALEKAQRKSPFYPLFYVFLYLIIREAIFRHENRMASYSIHYFR